MSSGSFWGTIFRSIGKAVSWVIGEEDEKLRAARARGRYSGEKMEVERDEEEGRTKKRSEAEHYATEYDIWDEIDSFRTTFWFGSRMARLMSKSRRRDAQLMKELEELDRQKEEEKREKGEA